VRGRWGLLTRIDVTSPVDGTIHLRRHRLIQTPWFGIYVHELRRPDQDRDCHDHPWRFRSWVLRGWYTEEIRYGDTTPSMRERGGVLVRRRRWSTHRMPTRLAHRIVEVGPRTVTLVLVGRKLRDWGFWVDGRTFVPWQEYIATRGHGPDPFGSDDEVTVGTCAACGQVLVHALRDGDVWHPHTVTEPCAATARDVGGTLVYFNRPGIENFIPPGGAR
jgi:hypothetical protein